MIVFLSDWTQDRVGVTSDLNCGSSCWRWTVLGSFKCKLSKGFANVKLFEGYKPSLWKVPIFLILTHAYILWEWIVKIFYLLNSESIDLLPSQVEQLDSNFVSLVTPYQLFQTVIWLIFLFDWSTSAVHLHQLFASAFEHSKDLLLLNWLSSCYQVWLVFLSHLSNLFQLLFIYKAYSFQKLIHDMRIILNIYRAVLKIVESYQSLVEVSIVVIDDLTSKLL